MDVNLLDKMLTAYKDKGTPVTVVLQNRARVTGKVRAYDNYVLILDGQRTEIVYRHAVSSLLTASAAAAAERPAPQRTAPAKPAPRPAKPQAAAAKQREQRHAPKAALAAEPSLNTGMKEGLLRWMQEQKASK